MAVYNLNLESGTIVPSTKVDMKELNKQSITRMEINTEGDSVAFYLEVRKHCHKRIQRGERWSPLENHRWL